MIAVSAAPLRAGRRARTLGAVHPAALLATLCLPLTVGALLRARWRGQGRLVLLTKGASSGLFLVAAFVTPAADPGYGAAARAALVLCAAGDLCLVGETRRALGAGIVAFGLGHLAFCAAFAPRARLDVTLALGLPLAAVAGAVLWRVRARLGALALPASAYALAVSATAALGAGALAAAPGAPGRALLGAGAALFFASDLAVARQRFATDAFVNRVVGVPLYYAATMMLALSVGQVT